MRLPESLQEKINKLYYDFNKQSLSKTRENLTNKYKTAERNGKIFVENEQESKIYAISRMPATYAVIFSLITALKEQNLLSDIHCCLDIGSGTGAGYFALSQVLPEAQIELFERDQNMIDVFQNLCEEKVPLQKGNFNEFTFSKKYDLVMSSYVISEMPENDRLLAAKKMLEISNKYVLLIDTGTPKVFEDYKKIKDFALLHGAKILAPCMQINCPLKNDYCQFYARVERTAIHKMAKSASLGYEDEKYFYLLFEKQQSLTKDKILPIENNNKFRVICRPIYGNGKVDLMLCGEAGVAVKSFSKKQKEIYKQARKSKINDILELGEDDEI